MYIDPFEGISHIFKYVNNVPGIKLGFFTRRTSIDGSSNFSSNYVIWSVSIMRRAVSPPD